uniref:DUF4258 domain-containing protein n=1 Tax=Caenorhabditis tropicalis TaxID=1561998 RepID=A0A1I7V169_9PELO
MTRRRFPTRYPSTDSIWKRMDPRGRGFRRLTQNDEQYVRRSQEITEPNANALATLIWKSGHIFWIFWRRPGEEEEQRRKNEKDWDLSKG